MSNTFDLHSLSDKWSEIAAAVRAQPGQPPELPRRLLPAAREVVNQLLTDAEARLTYFEWLAATTSQRLRFPKPLWERGDEPINQPKLLAPDRAEALVERGELSDEDVPALLVTPFDLQILAELIDASLPEVWLNRISQAGKPRKEKSKVPDPPLILKYVKPDSLAADVPQPPPADKAAEPRPSLLRWKGPKGREAHLGIADIEKKEDRETLTLKFYNSAGFPDSDLGGKFVRLGAAEGTITDKGEAVLLLEKLRAGDLSLEVGQGQEPWVLEAVK